MSGRIPQQFIDTVRERVNIIDVVRANGVELKKSGREHIGRCPFHDDNRPSFAVNEAKQVGHCFGCGKGVDVFSFLMELQGISFVDALEQLAETLGMEVPRDAAFEVAHRKSQSAFEVLLVAWRLFEQTLETDRRSRAYLDRCGLTIDVCRTYGVGASTAGAWKTLFGKIEPGRLQEVGLATLNRGTGELVPPFEDALMLPVKDRRGRAIGFIAQPLPGKDQPVRRAQPLANSEIFQAAREVFGIPEATPEAEELNGYVVVESALEVVYLAQRGIRNAVAPASSPASTRALKALLKAVPNLLLIFPSDPARREAIGEAIESVLAGLVDGADAAFAFLPRGQKSSAAFVREYGVEAYQALEEKSIPVIDLLYRKLAADTKAKARSGRQWVLSQGRGSIGRIPSDLYRQVAMNRFLELMPAEPKAVPPEAQEPKAPPGAQTEPEATRAASPEGVQAEQGSTAPEERTAPAAAAPEPVADLPAAGAPLPATGASEGEAPGEPVPTAAKTPETPPPTGGQEPAAPPPAPDRRNTGAGPVVSGDPASDSEGEPPEWVARVVGSAAFKQRLERGARTAPKVEDVVKVLVALEANAGRMTVAVLGAAVGKAPFRMPGLLSGMKKLLNTSDTVITVEDATDTVILNINRLKKTATDDG